MRPVGISSLLLLCGLLLDDFLRLGLFVPINVRCFFIHGSVNINAVDPVLTHTSTLIQFGKVVGVGVGAAVIALGEIGQMVEDPAMASASASGREQEDAEKDEDGDSPYENAAVETVAEEGADREA